MRKYSKAWQKLKQDGRLEITVNAVAVKRVLNGIKKEKSADNIATKAIGDKGWTKLRFQAIVLSESMRKIVITFDDAFSCTYNTAEDI